MKKLVAGVGINDLRGWSWKGLKNTEEHYKFRVYTLWYGMISRCYNSKSLEKDPCYKGCSVCERWHRLSNFAEDISKIPNYELWKNDSSGKIFLDKDIRIEGNREYSLDACSFVTQRESIADVTRRHGNCKKPKPVIAIFSDGRVKTYESAYAAVRDNPNLRADKISECCRGNRKTHCGHRFCFA